jgi:hypothetical protein
MCSDFGSRVPYDEYLRAFSEIRIRSDFQAQRPILSPATISAQPRRRRSFGGGKTG